MGKKYNAKVRHMNEVVSISFVKEKSLLENLVKAKVPIGRSCNGEGICTTCRIIIKKGELTAPKDLEQTRRLERGFNENERLACQCRPISDELHIEIP